MDDTVGKLHLIKYNDLVIYAHRNAYHGGEARLDDDKVALVVERGVYYDGDELCLIITAHHIGYLEREFLLPL